MHDHLITFLAPVTTRHGQQQVKAFQIVPAVTSRHDRHTPLQAPRCCERRSRQSLGPAAIVHRMGLSVECSCGRQQTVLLAAPSFVQDAFRQTKFAMVSTMAENSQRTIPQTGPALIVKSNDQGCAKLQSSRPRAQGLATGCPVGRPGPSSHHKQNNRRSYQVPQTTAKKRSEFAYRKHTLTEHSCAFFATPSALPDLRPSTVSPIPHIAASKTSASPRSDCFTDLLPRTQNCALILASACIIAKSLQEASGARPRLRSTGHDGCGRRPGEPVPSARGTWAYVMHHDHHQACYHRMLLTILSPSRGQLRCRLQGHRSDDRRNRCHQACMSLPPPHHVRLTAGSCLLLTCCPPQIDLESSEDDIQEIQQEISVLSTCASSFVTQYKASFLRGHKLWIVMEFLGGGSCLDLVRPPGSFSYVWTSG